MRILAILLAILILSVPVAAQDLEVVADELAQPVFVTNAGDGSGRLFIVELIGRVQIYRNGQVLDTPFLDIQERVRTDGELGLLGMAFHPDFASNRR